VPVFAFLFGLSAYPLAAQDEEETPLEAPAGAPEEAPQVQAPTPAKPKAPKAAPHAAEAPKPAPKKALTPPPPPPLPTADERAKAESAFLQSYFSRVTSEEVLPNLAEQVESYLWEFRENAETDQAQYLKAEIDERRGDQVAASLDLLKLFYEYPQTELKMTAKQKLFLLVDKKFGKKIKPQIAEIAKGPQEGLDRPQRFAAFLKAMVSLKEPSFYQPLAAEFREYLRRYPGHEDAGDITYIFGQFHLQNGNYRNAILLYEKILAVYKDGPLAAKAQIGVGDTYAVALKDYNKAVEAYQVVTKKFAGYPEAGDAYVKLATIFDMNLKQPDLALETLDKIISNYEGTDSAYAAYQEMSRIQRERNKDFSRAVAALQSAAKMFAGEERAAAALKQASDVAGDELQDDTLKATLLKDIVANCPSCKIAPAALWDAGQVYEKRLKAPSEAITVYRKLISEYPADPHVRDAQKRITALNK
jgi:TolA-binding protein